LGTADALYPATSALFLVEVLTEPGDNTIDAGGYFSFAIDMDFGGTAGIVGADVWDVQINHALFDDVQSSFTGQPQGASYTGVSAATTSAVPMTFGYTAGDIVSLFTFQLDIPASAMVGQTLTITPSEGFLQNVVVATPPDMPEQVDPQNFMVYSGLIIPEPGSMFVLLTGSGALLILRQLRRSRR
jgi:hypothetical protein